VSRAPARSVVNGREARRLAEARIRPTLDVFVEGWSLVD
jgi:hypothetical protein